MSKRVFMQKPFNMKMCSAVRLSSCKWQLICIWKALNKDSFWNRGTRWLGNGLLHEGDAKRGKTSASESSMVLVLLCLIQSCCVVDAKPIPHFWNSIENSSIVITLEDFREEFQKKKYSTKPRKWQALTWELGTFHWFSQRIYQKCIVNLYS